MKKVISALTGAALLVSGANAAPGRDRPDGEAKLAKLIAGRVAGKPISCIPAQISDRLQVIDRTAMVYNGGNTVYVARPRDPRSLNTDDILVINRFGSQLCKQDIIRTVDRNSGFMTGVVFLDDFVPYKRR